MRKFRRRKMSAIYKYKKWHYWVDRIAAAFKLATYEVRESVIKDLVEAGCGR